MGRRDSILWFLSYVRCDQLCVNIGNSQKFPWWNEYVCFLYPHCSYNLTPNQLIYCTEMKPFVNPDLCDLCCLLNSSVTALRAEKCFLLICFYKYHNRNWINYCTKSLGRIWVNNLTESLGDDSNSGLIILCSIFRKTVNKIFSFEQI